MQRLSDSPWCICNEAQETLKHFILDCQLYRIHRIEIMAYIDMSMTVDELLEGSRKLSDFDNKLMLKKVSEYIKKIKRLSF